MWCEGGLGEVCGVREGWGGSACGVKMGNCDQQACDCHVTLHFAPICHCSEFQRSTYNEWSRNRRSNPSLCHYNSCIDHIGGGGGL